MPFTIATYNILADSYIQRDWYPHTSDDILEPTNRHPALLSHLAQLNTDVLCLQEAEQAVFHSIENHLGPLGYKGWYSKKGGWKPDGCATFYRTDRFKIQEVMGFGYVDGLLGEKPSGHIAQIIILEQKDERLGIANTHLKWDSPGTPPNQQYGYRQITQLLQECERRASECHGWIICGDFNATPESALVDFIQQSGFRYTHASYPEAYTANSNGKAKTIDYLFHSPELEATPLPLPEVRDQTSLPGITQPSDHVAVTARFTWRH